MGKARTLFAVTLAFAVTSVCQAATLLQTDFTKGDTKGWILNGDQVKVVDVAGDSARPKALSLTSDEGSQTGVAYTELKQQVPSFSFIADVQIRHDDSLGCPADGFAMSFVNVDDTSSVGGGGGSMGLFGLDQFTAFEINTWRDQGAGTEDDRADCKTAKNETFAIDVVNPSVDNNARTPGETGDPKAGGAKIGQVVPPSGMKIVNGGFYRFQWNAAEDGTMTVYATGLSDSNKQFQKVKVLEVKLDPALKPLGFAGHWGLHAATGGAYQITEVAAARIDSPMIDPQ
jgi:Bacterial lectin